MKNFSTKNVALALKALLFSSISFLAFSCSKDDPSATVVPQMIAHYTFDGTYNNENGNMPFASNASTSFVTANSSIKIAAGVGTTADITGIPTGNQSRSIALTYKSSANVSTYPGVFTYGTQANKKVFGMYLGPNGNHFFQGFGSGNDNDFGGTYSSNSWRYVVITYNGANAVLFINGIEIGTFATVLDTGYSSFKLGNTSIDIEIADLRIYNYVLSLAEIKALTPQMNK